MAYGAVIILSTVKKSLLPFPFFYTYKPGFYIKTYIILLGWVFYVFSAIYYRPNWRLSSHIYIYITCMLTITPIYRYYTYNALYVNIGYMNVILPYIECNVWKTLRIFLAFLNDNILEVLPSSNLLPNQIKIYLLCMRSIKILLSFV